MDILADWLAVASVHGSVGARIHASGDWGIRWNEDGDAVLYAITSGMAWIEVEGMQPALAAAGDVFLVTAGTPHAIASAPASMPPVCDSSEPSDEPIVLGTGGPATRVLAARYRYDSRARTQVLAHLPTVVHIRSELAGDCLADTVRLLGRELAESQPATSLVLDRLVDIMLIQLLRSRLSENDRQGPPLLRALADPVVHRALHLIHEAPNRPWTAESLARAALVSRATLARRFDAVLATSPSAYLTQWRMDLAAQRLRDTSDSIESIAHDVGYSSLPAFSRAFARLRKETPGRHRESAKRDIEAPRDRHRGHVDRADDSPETAHGPVVTRSGDDRTVASCASRPRGFIGAKWPQSGPHC
ncbi:AraC family transcriptional regulator [Kitasatospora sp. NPDC101155]|uniref:AraC family transcriptional regulator n=1 Tax=Kitasatospora sp. NPDC101155 TaxID=3364097 RepID=UPI003820E084